jgi:D-amino peptidase
VRVLIVSDMEGVAGISRWAQVMAGQAMYEEGRRLYTEEINAAVDGAFEGGATEVVVMDCHGAGKDHSFNSLIPESLDARCEFVVQRSWTEYTTFLEEGCDAALFVAMHAKAGTPDGVLSHTVKGTEWRNLWFNDVSVGETGINAALCGAWECPVLLVTGDAATCREATSLLGEGLTTVSVKTGLGRFSARHLAPVRARELIAQGAAEALRDVKAVAPHAVPSPCTITVQMTTADQLEPYRDRSGIELDRDEMTVTARDDVWFRAWRRLYF